MLLMFGSVAIVHGSLGGAMSDDIAKQRSVHGYLANA
jgi:hypothetical protein